MGSRSALDYLIKVRDYSFMEAVELIAGRAAMQPPAVLPDEKAKDKKRLLPKGNRYLTNVVSYLKGSRIDTELIGFCMKTGRIYESEYHHSYLMLLWKNGELKVAGTSVAQTQKIHYNNLWLAWFHYNMERKEEGCRQPLYFEKFFGHPVTNSEVIRLIGKQADKLTKRGGEVKIDFEDIYERFFKDVYLFVLSMSGNPAMAEEVTQETFFKALKEIDNFKGNCSVKSWLCQIAKNLYIDDIRRRKRFEAVKTDLTGKPREEGNTEKAAIRQEEVISIYKVLHCLEEPYKEVFGLRTLGELSYREIGEIFGKSESWARVTYHRAKLKIREHLM